MAESKTMKRLSDEDWGILLPGTPHAIGNTSFDIVPLGVEDIKEAMVVFNKMVDELKEKEINQHNYAEPTKIVFLTKVALTELPEVVARSAGMHVDDIKRLPLAEAVKLVTKVIEVNIDSNSDLEKNLEALAEMMTKLRKTGESETSSTSSSVKATPSEI